MPTILIVGTNSLLIFDFVRSKKKVYTNEQLKTNKSFRTNLRSTLVYASVYSISFVVVSLPKMLVLLLTFANRNSTTFSISAFLTAVFDLIGNCYYVFNFFFLAIMNKQFLYEIKSILKSLGLLKNLNDLQSTRNMSANNKQKTVRN